MGRTVFADANRARVKITKAQAKSISKMYRDLSEDIRAEAKALQNRTNVSSILRTQYLDNLSKQINEELRQINASQSASIKSNMAAVSSAVVKNNEKMLYKMGIKATGAYSYVPSDIVKEIASGQLYEGRWSLSTAIWKNTRKTQSDINMIVAKGVAGQKSTYEIAKDLEKYVNPSAKKDWQWSKVYPGTAKVVDYNAQRLARTMVSHAYQDSVMRVTKDNPFVECYEWMTSNSDRVCPVCEERESGFHGVVIDGQAMYGCYYADDVPLDHPNGMCTIAPYTVSYTEISNRLADWVNGKSDPDIDRFAKSLGYSSSSTLKSKVF